MTTKKLAEKVARDVERMSGDEKAKLRKRMRREFGIGDFLSYLHGQDGELGLVDSLRKIQKEEQLLLDFNPEGKPIN